MKKMFKKSTQRAKNGKGRFKGGILPSAITALLVVASFNHKMDIKADNGSVGRGALFGGLTGATIGGIAGGGKGAGIGAAVGLGVGALAGAASSSRSRESDPFRQINKLESKKNRLERRAARTSSEEKRARYQREIQVLDNQISNIKATHGIR